MTIRPLLCLAASLLALPASHALEAPLEQRQANIERSLPPAQVLKGAARDYPSLAAEMERLKVPGVSVAVIRAGQLAWTKGYGVGVAGGAPVTPATLFQAASISKPVTAMAALALVQNRQLALERPIDPVLGSWTLRAANGKDAPAVTLQQLLSHTAGAGVHGFPGYAAGAPLPTVQQVLDGAAPANTKAVRIDTPPGKAWRYSGGGYTVVQLLLAERAAQPFAQLLDASVLSPLGMRASSFTQPATPAILARAALPHGADGNAITGGPHTYPELAAAGLWTTPADLALFAIEVQQASQGKGKVLDAASAQRMLTPVKNGYALGLAVTGKGAARAFSHGGSNQGYQNELFAYVQDGSGQAGDGAVVMTNSDAGSDLARSLIRAIAAEYGWPGYRSVERSSITPAPALAAALPGTYRVKDLGDFRITSDQGVLTLWLRPGQGQRLYAQSPTVWFVLGQELELRLSKPGDVRRGRVVAGGFDVPFYRVP